MRTASGTVNVNYLFDSLGRWIAFRKRQYVFDRDSHWIGWTPWGDNEVYAPNGSYLGTITYGNRLYCYHQREDRGTPGTVEPPPFPGSYSEPVSPGRAVLLPWAEDLDFSFHAEMDWSSELGHNVSQDLGFTASISSYHPKETYHAAHIDKLPALDLDVESLSQSESPINRSPVVERNISRSRYEDDYDDYDRRPVRSRSRYEDDYDDYDRRPVRSRSRYEDDYDDYDRRPVRSRSRYEDDYDDYDRRPVRSRSRYEEDDRRRPVEQDKDEEFNRKKEIDRLRLIISKHAQKADDENDTLSQPLLKKTN